MTETEYVCPSGHVMADPTAPCEACEEWGRLVARHDALVLQRREIRFKPTRLRVRLWLMREAKKVERQIAANLMALHGVRDGRLARATVRSSVRSVLRRRGSASGRRA